MISSIKLAHNQNPNGSPKEIAIAAIVIDCEANSGCEIEAEQFAKREPITPWLEAATEYLELLSTPPTDLTAEYAPKIASFIRYNAIDLATTPIQIVVEQYFTALEKLNSSDEFKELVYNMLMQDIKA